MTTVPKEGCRGCSLALLCLSREKLPYSPGSAHGLSGVSVYQCAHCRKIAVRFRPYNYDSTPTGCLRFELTIPEDCNINTYMTACTRCSMCAVDE